MLHNTHIVPNGRQTSDFTAVLISNVIRNKIMHFFDLWLVVYDCIAAVCVDNCIFNKLRHKVNRSINRWTMRIQEIQMKTHNLRVT